MDIGITFLYYVLLYCINLIYAIREKQSMALYHLAAIKK